MPQISLTNSDEVALVSKEDFPHLSKREWHLSPQGYVVANDHVGLRYMHKIVASRKIQVDHKNLNRLDNTRTNVRAATPGQNVHNSSRKGKRSGFKGVDWHTQRHLWRARIRKDGTVYRLGLFEHPILAALAYDEKAKEIYGDFAKINFPDGIVRFPREEAIRH